ncbi:hemerythrin domain-containing protein [Dermatobacter hominis]|uniref:hemerythrin domain-containing protein n=1 Tax=Dermatobacter hominis TaxID=2884263 RepID=UPI001D115A33|nr:hemerythrin domain-containing protein [Dermatobacter hominis]UDY35175.1 hemerythrin domain-containing protein [Dermatobacter hominis]
MDAITLLKKDHRTVEQLFRRYEQAGDRAYAEKRRVVDRIIEELSQHAAIEEQVFYPAAREEASDTEDLALESIEEHHIVKWELSELEKMDPQDERFDAKVRVLMENVRHHVSEEESEFFPKVRDELGRNELNDLGDAMAAARKGAPTHPHPRAPQSGPLTLLVGPVLGVVDRVGDTVKGVVGGAARAAGDLVGRVSGRSVSQPAPTGSSTARRQTEQVRRGAEAVTDRAVGSARQAAKGAQRTARSATDGATRTAKAATAGAKGTATSARKGAGRTRTTAKRSASTTAGTARRATSSTRRTATSAARRTKKAAAG